MRPNHLSCLALPPVRWLSSLLVDCVGKIAALSTAGEFDTNNVWIRRDGFGFWAGTIEWNQEGKCCGFRLYFPTPTAPCRYSLESVGNTVNSSNEASAVSAAQRSADDFLFPCPRPITSSPTSTSIVKQGCGRSSAVYHPVRWSRLTPALQDFLQAGLRIFRRGLPSDKLTAKAANSSIMLMEINYEPLPYPGRGTPQR